MAAARKAPAYQVEYPCAFHSGRSSRILDGGWTVDGPLQRPLIKPTAIWRARSRRPYRRRH